MQYDYNTIRPSSFRPTLRQARIMRVLNCVVGATCIGVARFELEVSEWVGE